MAVARAVVACLVEEEDDFIAFEFEGVSYTRYAVSELDDGVYDDEFNEVGQWLNGTLVFTKHGSILHTLCRTNWNQVK